MHTAKISIFFNNAKLLNGDDLIARFLAHFTPQGLFYRFPVIDTATGHPAQAHHQRSDVCAVPAAGVVAEAMVALVLAESALEKFGGDSLGETRRNYHGYLRQIAERGLSIHG